MVLNLPLISDKGHILQLAVVAFGVQLFAASASAECDEIAFLPLIPQEPVSAEDGSPGFICTWKTELAWVPSENCGLLGFEVAGSGERPLSVEFKRKNTSYSQRWQTQEIESNDDAYTWTSATLAEDSQGNRCFAGWCEPKNYILRTTSAVSETLCIQAVALRIRLTDRVE